MRLARMHTSRKGVQPADAVRKPLFLQKFQRTVGDRRLVAIALGRQPFQHVIGPERPMRLQQDLQGPPPHRRQAMPAGRHLRLGPRHHIARTARMVMRGKRQIGLAVAVVVHRNPAN